MGAAAPVGRLAAVAGCAGQDGASTDRRTPSFTWGDHPEVAVCLGCAHFLHQQAHTREDASAPSPATRVRDGLWAARRLVIRQGWHEQPVIGPVLRWLGARLP